MSLEIPAGGSDTIRVVGLTATKYRVVDQDTGLSVVIGPITTGITNTGTQRYKATLSVPAAVPAGAYEVQWDDGSNTWTTATEDLTIGVNDELTDFTLTGVPWAVGATVSLYHDSNISGTGPLGTVVATATVSASRTAAFTSLALDTRWVAEGPASVRVRFRT